VECSIDVRIITLIGTSFWLSFYLVFIMLLNLKIFQSFQVKGMHNTMNNGHSGYICTVLTSVSHKISLYIDNIIN